MVARNPSAVAHPAKSRHARDFFSKRDFLRQIPANRASYKRMAGNHAFSLRVQDCTDRLAVAGVDALGSLFDLTSNRLVRFAVTITRNQHDAEDCVQAALVRIAREPGLLSAAGCPWAY